ncbi:UNVERIFIED_CONTAM: hypothetical protein NCL1_61451 [Trichonephila clavipes]
MIIPGPIVNESDENPSKKMKTNSTTNEKVPEVLPPAYICLAQLVWYVPQTDIVILLKYNSLLCTTMSKTILKALECNTITLKMFTKDLLITEKNLLISAFPFSTLHTPSGITENNSPLRKVRSWAPSRIYIYIYKFIYKE